jgi:hypothetical protein
MKRFTNWISEWAGELAIRLEVWQFERSSREVTVRRSCGHQETIRLAKKNLVERMSAYEASLCPKCGFESAMRELALKRFMDNNGL